MASAPRPEHVRNLSSRRSSLFTKIPDDKRAILDAHLIAHDPPTYTETYAVFNLEHAGISFAAFYIYARRVRYKHELAQSAAAPEIADAAGAALAARMARTRVIETLTDPEADALLILRLTNAWRMADRMQRDHEQHQENLRCTQAAKTDQVVKVLHDTCKTLCDGKREENRRRRAAYLTRLADEAREADSNVAQSSSSPDAPASVAQASNPHEDADIFSPSCPLTLEQRREEMYRRAEQRPGESDKQWMERQLQLAARGEIPSRDNPWAPDPVHPEWDTKMGGFRTRHPLKPWPPEPAAKTTTCESDDTEWEHRNE